MTWARIMTPLSGEAADADRLAAAEVIAAPFTAEVAGVYAPLDIASVSPWITDGIGADAGLEVAALDAIRKSDAEGDARARATVEARRGPRQFVSLPDAPAQGLACEARLSDVVVFDSETACGKTRLSPVFRNVLMAEQRPVVVAKAGLSATRTIVVAWDASKEATRAARTALPLLAAADEVIVLAAPSATSRDFEPDRLNHFLAARGVRSRTEIVGGGDAGEILVRAAVAAGADLLVAGAYGHTRLHEIIFGGVTKTLLKASGPSLFLSH